MSAKGKEFRVEEESADAEHDEEDDSEGDIDDEVFDYNQRNDVSDDEEDENEQSEAKGFEGTHEDDDKYEVDYEDGGESFE